MKYYILFLAITFYAVQVSNGGKPKGHDHGHGHGHGHGHDHEHGHKGDHKADHSHKGNHGDYEPESHNEITDHKKGHDHDKNHKHKGSPHGPHHPSHNEIDEKGTVGGHHCPDEPIYEKMHGSKPPGDPNAIYDTLRPHDPAYEVLLWSGNGHDYSHYDKLPKPLKAGEPIRPPHRGNHLYEDLKYPPYPYENLNYRCPCECGHRVGSHENIYEQITTPPGPLDSNECSTRPPLPIRPHDLGCSQSTEQSSSQKGKWNTKSRKGKSFRKKSKKY